MSNPCVTQDVACWYFLSITDHNTYDTTEGSVWHHRVSKAWGDTLWEVAYN